MKDFAKSIVCNVKAEVAKIGNAYQYAGNIPIEKIPDNWRPEFPKAGYVVYYAPNKAKWFATEAEAKRFAESQDKAQKAGNNVPDDMINGPAAAEIRETAGKVYKKEMREDDLARATAFELAKKYKNFQKSSTFMETIKDVLKKFKTGNSKVGNGITKFGLGSYVIADGHKAIVLGETVERGPNGIPFGWVTIRWVEGPWKGQSDQQYDYDLKKA